jgi:hypothetical protein
MALALICHNTCHVIRISFGPSFAPIDPLLASYVITADLPIPVDVDAASKHEGQSSREIKVKCLAIADIRLS